MEGILIILKKENGPRASSSPALGLNTIIFKRVYWYMQQISGERLQDHWSSGPESETVLVSEKEHLRGYHIIHELKYNLNYINTPVPAPRL